MKYINIIILVTAFLFVFSGCSEENNSTIGVDGTPVKMTFSVVGCNQNPVPLIALSAKEMISFTDEYNNITLNIPKGVWLNENVLRVEGHVLFNCAEGATNGSFEIKNSEIKLIYDVESYIGCGISADCTCPKKLRYTFSNLPKKEYTYDFKFNERECDRWTEKVKMYFTVLVEIIF